MARKQTSAEATEAQPAAEGANLDGAMVRVMAATTIVHDGATIQPGEELGLSLKQAAALLECGAAKPVTLAAEPEI